MKRVLWLSLVLVVSFALVMTGCKGGKKKGGSAGEAAGPVAAGEVEFVYTPGADEEFSEVYLAGDFTSWDSGKVLLEKQDDGSFSAVVELDPGTYKWKMIRDGQWVQSMEPLKDQIQPAAASFVDDGFGGKNAVLTVE